MYEIKKMIPEKVEMKDGRLIKPIIFLQDEYGGEAYVYFDDHCAVLALGGNDRKSKDVTHWFKEAVDALAEYRKREVFYNGY